MTQTGQDESVRDGDQGKLFTGSEVNRESSPKEEKTGEELTGERKIMQAIILEFKKLIGPIQSVTAILPGDPDSLDKLATALDRIPVSDAFSQKLDGLRKQAKDAVVKARQARVQGFGRIESSFIQIIRSQKQPYRQQGKGWRIGSLELEVRGDQGQCSMAIQS